MAATVPGGAVRRPLAEDIAAATRSVHSRLNKLIMANLPSALPPRAADPASYVCGLLHIAPIYITFEALWQNVLESAADEQCPGPATLPRQDSRPRSASNVSARMLFILRRLYLPGLMRSRCLRADIRHLTGWADHIVEEHLRAAGRMGWLGEFTAHIKRAVENRPHVLLAYSYIMYMALFSGGRFVRASLESAGESFWQRTPSPVRPAFGPCEKRSGREALTDTAPADGPPREQPNLHASADLPLRFFYFDTPTDGEDLRSEFKKLLRASDGALTDDERHDVVREAICIFDNMSLVVSQLETACSHVPHSDGAAAASEPRGYGLANPLPSSLRNPPGPHIRDSIAIDKRRRQQNSTWTHPGKFETADAPLAGAPQEPGSANAVAASPPDGGPFVDPRGPHESAPGRAVKQLCPGSSKSMRFETAAAQPERASPRRDDAGPTSVAEGFNMVTNSVSSLHITNWIVIATFGAVLLGAFLTDRRHPSEA